MSPILNGHDLIQAVTHLCHSQRDWRHPAEGGLRYAKSEVRRVSVVQRKMSRATYCLRRSIMILLMVETLIVHPAAAENGSVSALDWYAAYARDSRLVRLEDGRSLNLYCVGAGSPTVILESGISESAYSWRLVQWKIGNLTRVCAYDRAGLGRSSPGPLPRDTRAEVADLEELLALAKLKPPYVLVGHSMAGYNVRVFASRHLRDVVGIVLVDPSIENQVPMFEAVAPAIAENDKRQLQGIRACADSARTERVAAACRRSAPQGFPPELAAMFEAAFGLTYFQTVLSEAESFLQFDSQEVAVESHFLGATPLIVLTRGALSSDLPRDQASAEWKLWNDLHGKLAELSTDGSNRVVLDSGHYIQIDKPEAVIGAVTEVVTSARNNQRP